MSGNNPELWRSNSENPAVSFLPGKHDEESE